MQVGMQRKKYGERKEERMRQKNSDLHEVLCTEMEKSQTIRHWLCEHAFYLSNPIDQLYYLEPTIFYQYKCIRHANSKKNLGTFLREKFFLVASLARNTIVRTFGGIFWPYFLN